MQWLVYFSICLSISKSARIRGDASGAHWPLFLHCFCVLPAASCAGFSPLTFVLHPPMTDRSSTSSTDRSSGGQERVATGENGAFLECDLLAKRRKKDVVRLKLLPVGRSLVVSIINPEDKEEVGKITFFRKSDIKLVCQHRPQPTKENKGADMPMCGRVFDPSSDHVNIQSLLTHGWSDHFKVITPSAKRVIAQIDGVNTLQAFFGVKPKKAKVADSAAANANNKDSATSAGSSSTNPDGGSDAAVSEDVGATEPEKVIAQTKDPALAKTNTTDLATSAGVSSSNLDSASDTSNMDLDMDMDMDMDMDLNGDEAEDVSTTPNAESTNGEESEVGITVACEGKMFYDISSSLKVPPSYEFMQDYPIQIHSLAVQENFKNRNDFSPPNWTFTSRGCLFADNCLKTLHLSSDSIQASDAIQADVDSSYVCDNCLDLSHNQRLIQELGKSFKGNYPSSTPYALLPPGKLAERTRDLKYQVSNLCLSNFNAKKKIASISRKITDFDRLFWALQNNDVPRLRSLLDTHIRNGGAIKSFLLKVQRAADKKRQGHEMYRRDYIQRGRKNGKGEYSDDYRVILDLSFLMWKLGCRRLLKIYNFVGGGLSIRQVQRRITDGTYPSYVLQVTHCIDDIGRQAISNNLDATLFNKEFESFLPRDKVIVVIMMDGIAVDERLRVDVRQVPHQLTGACRHCPSTTISTWEDYERISDGFDRSGKSSDPDKFHHAKEMEVISIGFIHKTKTAIIPVAASPTCKKDHVIRESTHSANFLMKAVWDLYHEKGGVERIGPVGSNISDGASHLRNATAQNHEGNLPPEILAVYANCPLFNTAGNANGATISCDLDHNGKRSRARLKSAKGMRVAVLAFNKADFMAWFARARVIDDAEEAERLVRPADNMDVQEMVLCLQAISKIGTVAYETLPADWRQRDTSRAEFREIRLIGAVTKCMYILIIGHCGEYKGEEGDHMSVSELLTVAARLAHLLFVIFRKSKSDFIPNQNYRNWQDAIKNMFVVVTLHKLSDIEDFWWFLNTSKRLEQLFGIIRSMRNGDLNFDCLGLRDRLSDAAMIANIYAHHPEWDTGNRRLRSSMDRKNTASWKGCTKVANVDEAKCWADGRAEALAELRRAEIFTEDELDLDAILLNEGVNMLRPYRQQIGVLAGDESNVELVDLSGANDDETEL